MSELKLVGLEKNHFFLLGRCKKHSEATRALLAAKSLKRAVNVYNLDNTLFNTFSSQTEAAEWFGTSETTVRRHLKDGTVFCSPCWAAENFIDS